MRPGKGEGESDRVEIVWDNFAITNAYLQVTVKGDDVLGGYDTNTGLSESDVFYFGSIVADNFDGTPAASFVVNVNDEIGARNHYSFNKPVTNAYDFTKDGLVNVNDELLARGHYAFLLRINIAADGPVAAPAAEPLAVTDDGSESTSTPAASSEESFASEQDHIKLALAVRQPVGKSEPASPAALWLRRDVKRIEAAQQSQSAQQVDSRTRAEFARDAADRVAEILGQDDSILDSLLEDILSAG